MTDGHDTPVVIGGLVLDVANLVGKAEALAVYRLSGRPAFDGSTAHSFLSIEYSAWTWNGSSILMEVLLHGGATVGGWTAKQIHQAVLATFDLSAKTYALNQLRYDLRKLKGHGLLQREGRRYAYRLTAKGLQVALLFLFFHKRLCGPLANSRFHHKPDPACRPNSKLEAAYHKADKAIQEIVDLLAAA